jgi:hypothetical protein
VGDRESGADTDNEQQDVLHFTLLTEVSGDRPKPIGANTTGRQRERRHPVNKSLDYYLAA